ncbi:MAG: hypothetical protein M1305_05670 [Candidatus Marsarchaeota archaeon]|nr:hypothetical protein [Candidatus Marsarchaeota archaeon]
MLSSRSFIPFADTDRRARVDWAHWVKDLVDVRYPEEKGIVLVADNLNTHKPMSLYEAFPPAEAKRVADKLEMQSHWYDHTANLQYSLSL